MNDESDRLRNDLRIIEGAMGLQLWSRLDILRALKGVLGGGIAALILAIWSGRGGDAIPGLIIFLTALLLILSAKDFGFKRQPAPAPGAVREVRFYNLFYSVGGTLLGVYYIWGPQADSDPMGHFGSTIIFAGIWYLFYAISAPSRHSSVGGAIPLVICGFLIPRAGTFSDALCWLAIAACVGCVVEGAFLVSALRGPAAGSPPAGPAAPRGIRPIIPTSPSKPTGPLCNAAH